MKKVLLFLFLFIVPFLVYAEDSCDSTSIKIESIEVENKSSNVVENNKPSFDVNNLNVYLSFKSVGDNIKYKVLLYNTTDVDYEIDKNSLSVNSDYINYTIEIEDGSTIIKAGESKNVYLLVKYAKEVDEDKLENGIYNDNKSVVVNLANEEKDLIKAIENNPYTSTGIILIIVALVSGIVFIIVKKTKVRKYMILLIPVLLLIPYYVYAICKCEIKIESKVVIDKTFTGTIYRTSSDLLKDGSSIHLHEEAGWCISEDGKNCVSDSKIDYFSDSFESCNSFVDLMASMSPVPELCIEKNYSFGSDNYTLSVSEIDKSVYLKHDIEKDIVKNSYLCFVDEENREACIKYGDSLDDFSANYDVINNLFSNYVPDLINRNNMCGSKIEDGTGMFECAHDTYGFIGVYLSSLIAYEFGSEGYSCNISGSSSFCNTSDN